MPDQTKRDYGMERFERLRRIRSRLAENINTIFWYAEKNHPTYQEISARLLERVHHDPEYRKLPRHDHSYLEALMDSRRAELNRRGLFETKHYLDGALVLSKDVPAGRWHEVQSGGLYWKGTDKRYI